MHAFLIVASEVSDRVTAIAKQLHAHGVHDFDCVYPSYETESIGVAAVRDFIKRIALAPLHGRRSAGIIPDADLLTPEAQQALLKTIEEPPGEAYIFLGSTNAARLLPTIVSRCHVIQGAAEDAGTVDLTGMRTDIDMLLTAPAGKQMQYFETLGTGKPALMLWIDKAITVLSEDMVGNRRKRTILERLLRAKTLIPNNVNIRLLIENSFLQTRG